ncbi:hypothetical protein [Streptomyces boncukensis]|uniref:Aminoglycoside phosphotransferase domain-containing protein n=1 Tax=Streptomyces boncukensis TaxID=2711219 RepID=A0A6G4X1V4_9ACTN|nr:hypothetical protein [Streptomyces boncukensis]NGO70641.1 hypothetical protein [Streptomyces boncukensis]
MATYADAEIGRAARQLWPSEPVVFGDVVPSVTCYVRSVKVGERALYAKYSFLDASLVSVRRGVFGSWTQVREAQRLYAVSGRALLCREAAQLELLDQRGWPQLCRLAGFRAGALFTDQVTGPTLADVLLRAPERTEDLFAVVLGQVAGLQRQDVDGWLRGREIPERDLAAIFARKFAPGSAPAYLGELGAARLRPAMRHRTATVLGRVVARLRRAELRATEQGRGVLFGDLKPEHILYPEGPRGRPIFLDPGIQRGPHMADVAKLLSRTVLALLAAQPGIHTARVLVDELAGFFPRRYGTAPLHDILVLWAMDTTNILTTYLAAPADVPLPALGCGVLERLGAVLMLLDHLTWQLDLAAGAGTVWSEALDYAAERAA